MTPRPPSPYQPKSADDGRTIVPYITAWSEEQDPPYELVERTGGGIAYRDEMLADRDSHGVLWFRTPHRPGYGRPDFGRVHPLRQRRAMRRLLCQVCAGPADRTNGGILWLLRDHRDDWPDWPEGMGVTEPPICVPCVRTSVRSCPALRRGAIIVRVRTSPVVGVRGTLHSSTRLNPAAISEGTATFDDPTRHWIRAANLVRELGNCTLPAAVSHPLKS